jgi:hypothetical protein
MKIHLKLALATGLTLAGFGFAASSASAMPISGIDPAVVTSSDIAQGVQDVAWVCGPWGCHWRPNRYWGPRPYYRPWGWHRHWHRW